MDFIFQIENNPNINYILLQFLEKYFGNSMENVIQVFIVNLGPHRKNLFR